MPVFSQIHKNAATFDPQKEKKLNVLVCMWYKYKTLTHF